VTVSYQGFRIAPTAAWTVQVGELDERRESRESVNLTPRDDGRHESDFVVAMDCALGEYDPTHQKSYGASGRL
jgi:hypothetical protein